MQKLCLLLILMLFSICSASEWKKVWSDEFSKDGKPDSTKWSFDVEGNQWDWGNNELQNYTPANMNNAWVKDGKLIIEARKEKWVYPGDGQERDYTSARLRTINKGDWQYGKIEVKAKLPGGKGTWPAIWMLPTDNKYGGWPKSGEIDIMENIGSEPENIYCTVWNEKYESQSGKGIKKNVKDIYTKFHIYSIEWFHNKIDFFIDGKIVFTYTNDNKKDYKTWPFDQRFHLLLNIAIGGDWPQDPDPSIFPVRMEIDYVRIYQQGSNSIKSTSKNFRTHTIRKSKYGHYELKFTDNIHFPAQIKLYTTTGQEIMKKNILKKNNNVIIPQQSKGIYFLHLTDIYGKPIHSIKLLSFK